MMPTVSIRAGASMYNAHWRRRVFRKRRDGSLNLDAIVAATKEAAAAELRRLAEEVDLHQLEKERVERRAKLATDLYGWAHATFLHNQKMLDLVASEFVADSSGMYFQLKTPLTLGEAKVIVRALSSSRGL